MSKTDIDLDLLWDWCYGWERKTKQVVIELAELLIEHITDDKSHYYTSRLTDKLKELEENNKGLTKYLKEKIEELFEKKKKPHKDNSYIYNSIKEKKDA